jgi:RNA polymerase sigma-70 factor (ECF subfamily)
MRERVKLETVGPLLWKITLNEASKRRRWQSLRRWVGLSGQEAAPEAGTREADALKVRAAVEQLPEKLRDVMLLCEFSELSYAEVGEVLEIPPGTVGSRRNQALVKLRECLSEEVL